MTYDFNTKDADLEIPNPFKIENIFLLLSAAILFAGGVMVLLAARTYMQANESKVAMVSMTLAALLFGSSAKFGIQALSQFRFYYGRQFPKGLATPLKPTETGESPAAGEVMEIMRQRAIEFPEPTGPLNGVLYSMFSHLITSPPQIQAAAVQHFHSLIGMGAILLSLVASFVLYQGSGHEGVISWMYLPLTGLSLLTPFVQKTSPVFEDTSNRMIWSIVALVAFSIVGPVLIEKYIPAFPIPPMWVAPFLLLVCSMVGSALFLMSLVAKIDDVRFTSVSCEQTTIDMNCPPSQLWTEISRDFQNNWTRNIPNRTYANVPPDVSSSERGSFAGHILEETQPTPTGNFTFNSIGDAWREKYARFLILLSVWGMVLATVTTIVAVQSATAFGGLSRMEISRAILTVIALGLANALAFRTGHLLWSRMYFKSRLIWIEVAGTHQTSKLSIGNQVTGRTKSSSTLTRVEDATLRVWVTDIVSVAFGKEASRNIMALAPDDGFAKATAERLINFASNQSSIVAPTSQRDIGKAMALNALDVAMQTNSNELAQQVLQKLQRHQPPAQTRVPASAAARGTVKFFNAEKLFGFIVGDDAVERFFNSNHLGGHAVRAGDRVEFQATQTARGPQAAKVRPVSA